MYRFMTVIQLILVMQISCTAVASDNCKDIFGMLSIEWQMPEERYRKAGPIWLQPDVVRSMVRFNNSRAQSILTSSPEAIEEILVENIRNMNLTHASHYAPVVDIHGKRTLAPTKFAGPTITEWSIQDSTMGLVQSSYYMKPKQFDLAYPDFIDRVQDNYPRIDRQTQIDIKKSIMPPGFYDGYDFIKVSDGEKVVGTMQIADGSVARFGQSFSDNPVGLTPFPLLPISGMGAGRKFAYDVGYWTAEMREQQWKGLKIFEVGKFSIAKDFNDRDHARNMIELIWLTKYAEIYPEAIFVGHVNSQIHEDLYRRNYGFRRWVSFKNDRDTNEVNVLIAVEGWRLARSLRARLNMAPIDDSKFQNVTNLERPISQVYQP